MKLHVGSGKALVTLLDGTASVMHGGAGPKLAVVRGDFLARGDRVMTDPGSRMELKLPDGSFMRFDENTRFDLVSMTADPKTRERNISISVRIGRAWAKVAKFFGIRSRFEMATQTAVCGVRGTVYRMNVNNDQSAVVKVYEGAVEVRSKAAPAASEAEKADASPSSSNPTPIAGPHPVTMEQWVYIVSSLQQINISADGKATPPFRFDIMADLNDWVKWNKSRDKLVPPPDQP
jgi:hypothetical protein